MNAIFAVFVLSSMVFTGCVSAPRNTVAERSPQATALAVSAAAFDGAGEAFHPQANYLQMVLPYPPVRSLFESLQKSVERELISRGEAHVTVITPPEFAVLSKRISIRDINDIALADNLQGASLQPVCVGVGRAAVGGRDEETYYVVVNSRDLVRLRELIAERFIAKGGQPGKFDPSHYFPHITLGFTKADLHEAQGVIKDAGSCRYNLEVR